MTDKEQAIFKILAVPGVLETYAPHIQPHYFAGDAQELVSKSLQAGKALFGEPAGLVFGEEERRLLEDFLLRCKANELSGKLVQLTNQGKLLSLADLEPLLSIEISDSQISDHLVSKADVRTVPRYPTGIRFLSDVLGGGFSPGELVLFCAPPEGGKTHWLCKMGAYYALAGHVVVHVFLEDLPGDVLRYYRQGVRSYSATRGLKLNKDLWLFNYSGSSCTTAILARLCRRVLRGKYTKPPVIVLDYLEELADANKEERHRQRAITQRLRKIANENGAIVLTGTQGDAAMWEAEVPTMRNLSEAKVGKAAVVDVALLWSQLPEEKATGFGRLVIGKARGRRVPHRIIPVRVDWDRFAVRRATA